MGDGLTGWDIDPGGVRGVVKSTGAVAEGLEKQSTSYGKHLASAAKSAGTLSGPGGEVPEGGLVAVALSKFAMEAQEDLKYIALRAAKSLKGAVTATSEYVQGDLDMAAEAQRKALSAPDLDLPLPKQEPK